MVRRVTPCWPNARICSPCAPAESRRQKSFQGRSDGVSGGAAKHSFGGGIKERDALFFVNGQYGVHSGIDDTGHALLAGPQRHPAFDHLVTALADTSFQCVPRQPKLLFRATAAGKVPLHIEQSNYQKAERNHASRYDLSPQHCVALLRASLPLAQ
jgi:hypothetical protein